MILATHGIITSAGGIDPSYQAVLDYATGLGYTLPSLGQQIKQNKLLSDLKIAGIWNKLDTFGVFATDGSSDFALIDWKKLALYTQFNSPTFSTNGGFTGNGTSSYISTNFNPTIGTNNYVLDNASRFFWLDNRISTGGWEGTTTLSTNFSRNLGSGSITINNGTTSITNASTFNVDGWHSINRVSSLNVNIFVNLIQSNGVSLSTSIFNSNQFILRNGTAYNNARFRIYGMGASLSTENTAFYNAINTYLTSL
jgi:hypothetical protein